jgi:hypothetical protein
VTITAAAKDPQVGWNGSHTLRMDHWLSTQVPGPAEVTAFHRR